MTAPLPNLDALAALAEKYLQTGAMGDYARFQECSTPTTILALIARVKRAEEFMAGDGAFDAVEDMLVLWLDKHYPAGTIVCSAHPDADPGAKFTWALREALNTLAEGGPRG